MRSATPLRIDISSGHDMIDVRGSEGISDSLGEPVYGKASYARRHTVNSIHIQEHTHTVAPDVLMR